MANGDMQGIYAQLAHSFDAVAPGYDAAYNQNTNKVMGWLRAQNLDILKQTFAPRSHLLELGCGTGDEAIHLARLGYRVTATDISPGMVSITRDKALATGLANKISVAITPAARLNELQPRGPFDGAFASFGSLNCEPDLAGLATNLAALLKPGARFVFSVMARFSPFELAWFLAHGRPVRATRRLKSGWQSAIIHGDAATQATVSVRYLSTARFRDAFQPFFELEKTACLGLFIPPPFLDGLYRQRRSLWDRFLPLERRLRERWPWRTMGDHIVLVMRRS